MLKPNHLRPFLFIMTIVTFVFSGCARGTGGESASSTEAIFGTGALSETEAMCGTDAVSETEAMSGTDAVPTTVQATEPATERSTEQITETLTPSEADTTASMVPSLTINDIAFIGDSRTLTMATGGRYEFGLIPTSCVFATWGGELTQDSAKNNALAAAAADRKLAIFWYGINDVQSDPEQKLAPQFRANYEAIIDLYRNTNPDSDIVILSILSTSVHEKDYYVGQEENIRVYNAELAALCAQEGYTYLDISKLFTGDECLAVGDYIHFSKEWYEERFLPTVLETLNLID